MKKMKSRSFRILMAAVISAAMLCPQVKISAADGLVSKAVTSYFPSKTVMKKTARKTEPEEWNQKEIKYTKIRLKQFLKDNEITKQNKLKNENLTEEEINEIVKYHDDLALEKKEQAKKIIMEQKKEIKSAKYDNKHCNKYLLQEEVKKINEKYAYIKVKEKEKNVLFIYNIFCSIV